MNTKQYSSKSIALAMGLLVVFMGLTSLVGCDDEGGQFVEGSKAKLVVTPRYINFTQLAPGESHTEVIVVTNEGEDTLVLPFGSYSLEPADSAFVFQYMQIDGQDIERLEPQQEAQIYVTYFADLEQHQASLILEATNGDRAEIELNTVAPIPEIQVNPSPLLFGGAKPGVFTTATTTVSNVGMAPLTISQVSFVPQNTTDFSIVGALPATPTVLQPGEQFLIEVGYEPKGDIDAEDLALLIFNSDTGGSAMTTEVEVRGVVAGPRIDITPYVVDFGAIEKNQTELRQVVISNVGEEALVVDQVYLSLDTPADFFYGDLTSFTLEVDQEQVLSLSYTPTDSGIDSGYLVFESNDPLNPGVRVNLIGAWAGPVMDVKPKQIDFGEVALGASKTLDFSIYNDGTRPLTVEELVLVDGPADLISWSFDNGITGTPFEVEANQHVTVSLTFTPTGETAPITQNLEVRSNDPEEPTDTVILTYTGLAAGQCNFQLIPTTLNFGLVPGGYSKQMPIMVRNTGAGPCTVNSVSLEADLLSLFYGNPFSFVAPFQAFELEPGESTLIEFDYSPFSGGDTDTFASQAVFNVTDTISGQTGLSCPSASFGLPGSGGCSFGFSAPGNCWACLSGRTGDPALAAVPGDVDFGLVTLGCDSQTQRLRIYNKGTAPTNLQSIALDSTCDDNFSLTGLPSLPMPLDAGQFHELELVYTPSGVQADSCRVLIVADSEDLTVPIAGEGTTDENVTDIFTQVSGREVDVLFVVDTSGSMGDDQSNLANNFSDFIASALEWDVDFQIGVTTTDDDDDGFLQSRNGRPRIIASSAMNQSEVQAAFEDNIQVGDSGSSTERGLKAAEIALSAPLTTDDVPGNCPGSPNSATCAEPYSCDTYDDSCGGYNARFLRDDASLEIIFVSDEVDQSPAVVDYYVDFFKNIKGYQNESMLHAHAIIGWEEESGQCDTGGYERYKDVANRTGGRVEPLCGDFSTGLGNIGDNAFGVRVQFFLSRAPEVATLHVDIGGVELTTGWTYDDSSNSIVFDEAAAPTENETLTVTYRAACF